MSACGCRHGFDAVALFDFSVGLLLLVVFMWFGGVSNLPGPNLESVFVAVFLGGERKGDAGERNVDEGDRNGDEGVVGRSERLSVSRCARHS